MRTTIDLPEDIHRIAVSIARERNVTLSRAVVDLIRRALDAGARESGVELVEGIPVVRIGRPITSGDVRALEDEE
jgi:plasmid stabilization system protein ParE